MKPFLIAATAAVGVLSLAQSVDDIGNRKVKGVGFAKQIAVAVLMYEQDFDGKFPLAKSQAAFQKVVYPYLKNSTLFKDPNPNGGFLMYHLDFSGKSLASVTRPAETAMISSQNAWPDGGRVVGFVDGHAKYVSAAAWTQVRKKP